MIESDQDPIDKIWAAMCEEVSQDPHIDLRRKRIFLSRFGPDEDSELLTLQQLGAEYSVSRERVRQLQNKIAQTVVRKASCHSSILSGVFVEVLGDPEKVAEREGIKHLTRLLLNARCPKPFRELTISCAIVRFKWVTNKKRLFSELDSLLKDQSQADCVLAKSEKEASLAREQDAYLLRIFQRAELPQTFLLDRPALATTKQVREAQNHSNYFSDKLSRLVGLDSSCEEKFLRALDRSKVIVDFVEQPFVIPYTYQGKTRTYIPDFLVRTVENIQIVVEIKSPLLIADATVQAMARGAQTFLQERGLAYVLCDSSGMTPSEMKNMDVGEDLKELLRKMLRKHRVVTFNRLVQSGPRLPSLSELRGVQALSLQHPSLVYRASIGSHSVGQNPWSVFDFSLELN